MIWASAVARAPKIPAIADVIPVRSRMSGPRARARNSIGSDRAIAKRSAFARASVLGTSSAKTIVNSARMTVTMISARPSAVPLSIPRLRSASARYETRLTAA